MIRVILGFLMVYGSVGGIDTATDTQLFPLMMVAMLGLTLMYFGMNKVKAAN